MCHQPLQVLAASCDCTRNADRTHGTPAKGSCSRQSKKLFREVITTHPQRVWSIKDILVSDESRRLCTEVRETEMDLVCEVKTFHSWSCFATLAVLT